VSTPLNVSTLRLPEMGSLGKFGPELRVEWQVFAGSRLRIVK